MSIDIEFDGGVIKLREPKRTERIAAMDLRQEILALDDKAEVPRDLMERAEAVLLGMVHTVVRNGETIEGASAREVMEDSGLFLTEGLSWLQVITFRQAGRIVAGNGDIGSRGASVGVGAEGEGVATS